MDIKEFGRVVVEKRKHLKLSQQELATRAGVSRNYVSLIERGAINNVSAKVIQKLALALGMSTQDISSILLFDEEAQNSTATSKDNERTGAMDENQPYSKKKRVDTTTRLRTIKEITNLTDTLSKLTRSLEFYLPKDKTRPKKLILPTDKNSEMLLATAAFRSALTTSLDILSNENVEAELRLLRVSRILNAAHGLAQVLDDLIEGST